MNNLNIDLNNYAPAEAQFGAAGDISQEDLQNLNKALQAQHVTGRDTANLTSSSGSALKVESLDRTLKNLSYSEKNVVLWKSIPKKPAYNTVEEYNQLASYGAFRGGFNPEGVTPPTEDSVYIRRAQLVKYLGITKEVSHQMQLVNSQVGNVIEQEVKNGTLWLMRRVDRALWNADSRIIPDEFDGLYAQHQNTDFYTSLEDYFNSEVVIDLKGQALTEDAIESAAEGIVENFGIGNQLFAPPVVVSNFVKNFYGNKFIPLNTEAITSGVVGQTVQSFSSQFGQIGLNHDVFMNRDKPKTVNSQADSAQAPVAPSTAGVGTPVAAVGADQQSNWDTAPTGRTTEPNFAGDYIYAVAAINRYGESPITVLDATPVTVAAGGSVDLEWTAGTGGTAEQNPTGFVIYRSEKGATAPAGTRFYPVFRISISEGTAGYDGNTPAATGNFAARDRNRKFAATDEAYLVQNDNSVYEFAQLAPLMKMNLAIVAPSYRFMLLLYGTPLLYVPKRMVRFINIGSYVG